ncbi:MULTISPECIES: YqgE/AlgH family protein [unclassified Thioalkalivibrio]|uniref:YqgE/AlgH family protein n=1 Tax=unclassified Thioalkalivibrio TaxID=2621013 RepID=UPI00037AAB96|nr:MULTISPECIES: YqgE/AlgH family protein [unclassified Thioalkalivibrio]
MDTASSGTLESSLRDQFLIAMPSLNDGLFSHAVAYVCEHDAEGALGLVINQPTELTLRDLLQHVELEPADYLPELPVFRGGPVQPEHGFVLHSSEQQWRATQPLTDQVSLTTSRDILEAINAGEGPQRVLITLGHAGWGPGQLESELGENAWLTAPSDTGILFETPPAERWSRAAELIGIDVNLISSASGHA